MRGLLLLSALAAGCAAPQVAAPPSVREGLNVLEGRPSGALGWRLWISPGATAARPVRLAIWLHPSRDSGETLIEPLAPLLARQGYALLVPLKADYRSWTSADIKALFAATVPHAAKTPGVDPQLPLLIGFSAGGQMALHLWQKAPDALGALLLIGTVPGLVNDQAEAPLVVPPREQVQATAVLSVVGEQERGAAEWSRAAPAWLAGGVPLTLKVVPARTHEWLIDFAEQALVEAWLTAISETPESSTILPPGG